MKQSACQKRPAPLGNAWHIPARREPYRRPPPHAESGRVSRLVSRRSGRVGRANPSQERPHARILTKRSGRLTVPASLYTLRYAYLAVVLVLSPKVDPPFLS